MHEQDAEILKELMLDMVKSNAVIMSDIAAVKADLKEHMRRTAVVETEITFLHSESKYLHRQVNMAKGALALVSFIALVVGIVRGLSS